ncbi:PseG/SpsG family protein [Nocardioides humi]|uniref:Spore coat protein n=1 Tax=Nocardioides humi TaxID=449461 RepID=A0ABN2B3I7_9ACTN|nr:spore coat protein [Nocardioides humi]
MSLIVFYCDLGPTRGTGHVMRCVALAEELAARGSRCAFVADFDAVPWAAGQVRERGFDVRPYDGEPAAVLPVLAALGPDAVVLDSYALPASTSRELRALAVPVLAIVDRDRRGLAADLYLDQNLGVSAADYAPGLPVLAGPEYALVRDEVLAWRSADPRDADDPPDDPPDDRPRVVAYFGGTDAFGAGPVVAEALARTGRPCRATFVAPRAETRDALDRVAWAAGQQVEVIGPPPSLMALVARADVVLSASGTSLVELFCIGSAAGVVCVVDNQVAGYELVTGAGLAAGLGLLDDLRQDPTPAVAALDALLEDAGLRARMREAGRSLVDGAGRARAAAALEALAAAPT